MMKAEVTGRIDWPVARVTPPPHGQFSEYSDGEKIGHRMYESFPTTVLFQKGV